MAKVVKQIKFLHELEEKKYGAKEIKRLSVLFILFYYIKYSSLFISNKFFSRIQSFLKVSNKIPL